MGIDLLIGFLNRDFDERVDVIFESGRLIKKCLELLKGCHDLFVGSGPAKKIKARRKN